MLATIMIGASGSGKSTWLDNNRPEAIICSADTFFMTDDGEYNFDAKKLGEAHAFSRLVWKEHLSYRKNDVAVDNTNLSIAELAYYFFLAHDNCAYDVEIILKKASYEYLREHNHRGSSDWETRQSLINISHLLDEWPAFWPKPVIIEGE